MPVYVVVRRTGRRSTSRWANGVGERTVCGAYPSKPCGGIRPGTTSEMNRQAGGDYPPRSEGGESMPPSPTSPLPLPLPLSAFPLPSLSHSHLPHLPSAYLPTSAWAEKVGGRRREDGGMANLCTYGVDVPSSGLGMARRQHVAGALASLRSLSASTHLHYTHLLSHLPLSHI